MPFIPEPHVIGNSNGCRWERIGMKLIDWGDFIFHGFHGLYDQIGSLSNVRAKPSKA